MPLDLYGERYSPLGNISGKGLGEILGTPTLDPLSVVVRESTQNSWDARRSGSRPRIDFRLRDLDAPSIDELSEGILNQLPNNDTGRAHATWLAQNGPRRVLEIADFQTSGLGGPGRANIVGIGEEATDFCDFMRNIGSDRDKLLGGGTWGYGKSSLYRASRLTSILVHTRAREGGATVERFMGCHLSPGYTIRADPGRGKYTGRHWWGRIAGDGVPDPVEGDAAGSLAAALNMPPRSGGERGTTIWVLDPHLHEDDVASTLSRIEQAILFNFWPKFIAAEDHGMDFRLFDGDQPHEIRTPHDVPPLSIFAEAYEKLKAPPSTDERGDGVYEIRCLKPKKLLGRLGMAKGIRKPRDPDGLIGVAAPLDSTAHHVALMRPAELVVKYHPVRSLENDDIEHGGVFIVDPEVEDAFAAAEPPAHDDWILENLADRDKTWVKVGMKRIDEKAEEFIEWRRPERDVTGPGLPLARLAGALGGRFLDGVEGRRAGGGSGKKRKKGKKKQDDTTDLSSTTPSGGRTRNWTCSRPVATGLDSISGVPTAVFTTSIRCEEDIIVQASPRVILEGGMEEETATGGRPTVKTWTFDDGTMFHGESCRIDAGHEGEIRIHVSIPDRCAIGLAISARSCEAAETPEADDA